MTNLLFVSIIFIILISTPSVVNAIEKNSSKKESNTSTSGKIKGISAISIPASKYATVFSHTVYGYGCTVSGCPTYVSYDPYSTSKIGIDSGGVYRTWVTFPLSSLPAGQTIFSAKLRNSPLSCYPYSGNATIGTYSTFTFYYTSAGTRDPSTDSNFEQWNRSSGSDGWNDAPWRPSFSYAVVPCPSLANVDLGPYAGVDIEKAKSLVNRISLGISGNFYSGGWSYSQPIGSTFFLDLTYGIPEIHIRANNSDGPIIVKAGSNVALSWDSQGYDTCAYNSTPAWYTEGWPIGKKTTTSGNSTTKIYYENMQYIITCTNTGTGSTKSDVVVVNVTP